MKKVPLDYVKDILNEYSYSFDPPADEYKIKTEGLKNSKTIEDVVLWCQYWKLTPPDLTSTQFVNRIIEKGSKFDV